MTESKTEKRYEAKQIAKKISDAIWADMNMSLSRHTMEGVIRRALNEAWDSGYIAGKGWRPFRQPEYDQDGEVIRSREDEEAGNG